MSISVTVSSGNSVSNCSTYPALALILWVYRLMLCRSLAPHKMACGWLDRSRVNEGKNAPVKRRRKVLLGFRPANLTSP